MTFRLEGFPELEKSLAEVAKRSTAVAITQRSLRNAAVPMRDLAKRYAPIDSGDLEKGIALSVRATGEVGRAAFAAAMRETSGDTQTAVAAMRAARRAFKAENPPAILYLGPTREIFYAKFVEMGTRPRKNGGRFPGTNHPGTAPEPYLRPAFDAEAQATIDRVAAAMRVEIEKHAKRVAARKARLAARG